MAFTSWSDVIVLSHESSLIGQSDSNGLQRATLLQYTVNYYSNFPQYQITIFFQGVRFVYFSDLK